MRPQTQIGRAAAAGYVLRCRRLPLLHTCRGLRRNCYQSGVTVVLTGLQIEAHMRWKQLPCHGAPHRKPPWNCSGGAAL